MPHILKEIALTFCILGEHTQYPNKHPVKYKIFEDCFGHNVHDNNVIYRLSYFYNERYLKIRYRR